MVSVVRVLSIGMSALLHGGALLYLVSAPAGSRGALDVGSGQDMLMVEQGIAIEGLSQIGDLVEAVEAREVQPVEAQAAVQPVEEVKTAELEPPPEVVAQEKPPELLEKSEVITSKAEEVEEQEILREAPPEREVKPMEVAAVQPVEALAPVEQQVQSKKQEGGDPTLRMAYLGKLRGQIERRKLNPNSRDQGTVVVRFVIEPDGRVSSRQVAQSSGSKRLDDAALASIERASPFPPFPEGVGTQAIVVNLPFRFFTR